MTVVVVVVDFQVSQKREREYILVLTIPLIRQFYENYKYKNTDGVSITFLTLWIFGDILNLFGVILEHLLFTMVYIYKQKKKNKLRNLYCV